MKARRDGAWWMWGSIAALALGAAACAHRPPRVHSSPVITDACTPYEPSGPGHPAQLSVTVRDSQDQALPGAFVLASWREDSAEMAAGGDGVARLAVPAGAIRVDIALAGFVSVRLDEVHARTGCSTGLAVSLPGMGEGCKGSKGGPCI